MKKRWTCLFVENDTGVLVRIAGLFSGKSYNLDSLTVGITEDSIVSRMTTSLTSDDKTFEQVKRQLSRNMEIIKAADYTDVAVHSKGLMSVKISSCSERDMEEIFRISQVFDVTVIDYLPSSMLIESVQTEECNNQFLALLEKCYANRFEIVRGGSVAMEFG